MKITCSRTALLTACQSVAPAVAAHTTIPVLKNLKAAAHGDTLTLVAYDPTQGIGIRYALPRVTVDSPGECILPKGPFLAILQQNTDPQIELDVYGDESGVAVRTGGNDYEMPWMDPAEFPDFPEFEDDNPHHEVSAGAIRMLIARTQFAADKKETCAKFALTGVLWEAAGGILRLIGTDTKRLALCEAAYRSDSLIDAPGDHIVPLKAITLLGRLLEDDAEVVRVTLRSNDALFRTERATIYTALVAGRFPPHEAVLKKAHKDAIQSLTLSVAELLARVRQAAIMTDDETARVDMTFAPGQLTMAARGTDRGSSAVRMGIEGWGGEPLEVAFDPQYLIEFLRALGDEPTVVLALSAGGKMAVFSCGESTRYLVQALTG